VLVYNLYLLTYLNKLGKISEVPEAVREPWSQFKGKRKEAMMGMICGKDRFYCFKLGVKGEGVMGDERKDATE